MTTPDLDARGLLCPLPVLKLRKALKGVAEGGNLTMLADDPAARVDVPHFCAEQGHTLVSLEDLDAGVMAFVVARGGASGR